MDKAQVWTLDLIAGIAIFTAVVIVYFVMTNNVVGESQLSLEDLTFDSSTVSETLMTAGDPIDWEPGNVNFVGLTNGKNRINSSKVVNANNIDYFELKRLLKTKYDFLIFFENGQGETLSFETKQYIGKSGVTKSNIFSVEKPSALVQTKRFLIYNSSIVYMVVFLWQ